MTELRPQPRMTPGNADQQVAAAFQSGGKATDNVWESPPTPQGLRPDHTPELPGDRYMSVTVVAERLNVSHDTVLRCFSGYPRVIDTSEEALTPNKPWQRGKRHRRMLPISESAYYRYIRQCAAYAGCHSVEHGSGMSGTDIQAAAERAALRECIAATCASKAATTSALPSFAGTSSGVMKS